MHTRMDFQRLDNTTLTLTLNALDQYAFNMLVISSYLALFIRFFSSSF